jgi:hypothetical protein
VQEYRAVSKSYVSRGCPAEPLSTKTGFLGLHLQGILTRSRAAIVFLYLSAVAESSADEVPIKHGQCRGRLFNGSTVLEHSDIE